MATEYRRIANYIASTRLGIQPQLSDFLAYRFEEVDEQATMSKALYKHHFYELSLEINEGCSFQIDGFDYPLQGKRLSIIAPQRLQSNTVHADYQRNSKGFSVFIEPTFLGEWTQNQLLSNHFHFLHAGAEPVCNLNQKQLYELEQLFTFMHQEQQYGDIARSSLQHLLLVVFEKAKGFFKATPPARMYSPLVSNFLHLCHSSQPENLQLQALAQRLAVTPKHLSAMVKEQTGRTALETINDRRLLLAKRLLRESTHSVKEVAYRCGFEHLEYFHVFFKKMTGQTPLQFRQN